MLIAILGVKRNARSEALSKHEVTFYAHCYTWSEALCLLQYMECCFMLIPIHGVKL